MRVYKFVLLATLAFISAQGAEHAARRYALILHEPSAGRAGRTEPLSVRSAREQRILAAQARLRTLLVQRQFIVTGAVQLLLNAVFVRSTEDRVPELKSMPGVEAVIPLRSYRRVLNRAVPLMNAPGAWNALGGVDNAGRGVKIAILDTGIDQNHPAFRDPTLTPPQGYPICSGGDCAFTNNKVIVARSYVRLDAQGTPPNPAADSRPDDYSPRDRVGHGTAVGMSAAGNTNTGPSATITGMTPHAFLGNYKIFGSPGVNDGASSDAIIMALEDAARDGMDIAELSLGGPATAGPLDTGSACGLDSPNAPCDPIAFALETAAQNGMVVIAAGGNEADTGLNPPSLNTADSPGDAPSAISVGAVTNGHTWITGLRVPGNDVPSSIQFIAGRFGDGPLPQGPLTAPLRDVSKISGDALACNSLPQNSLNGTIALIQRGTCNFVDKVLNAQNAGAVGVILYQASGQATITPGGLSGTMIPAVLIGQADGQDLKDLLSSHPDHPITIDPTPFENANVTANIVAQFSSRGPGAGNFGIKPEIVAIGTDMYMATESLDAQGEMYSANGYTVADGTSFAVPLVSGAAALVKQKHPNFSVLQVKSALVNTAAQDLIGTSGVPTVLEVGAGRLDAGAATAATLTAEPATISFGILNNATLPLTQTIKFTNTGGTAVNLSITVSQRTTNPNASVSVNPASLSVPPGQTGTVMVSLSGSIPSPGDYDGALVVNGAGNSFRVPYLYLVGDGVPADIIDLNGGAPDFEGTVNAPLPPDIGALFMKVIDKYGVPVANTPVRFAVTRGGQITNADSSTDQFGIAGAEVTLGPTPGTQRYTGSAGGMNMTFSGIARLKPVITAGGIVNAASFEANKPLAPGSYISIFGTALSDVSDQSKIPVLPLSLDEVSVSFDDPSTGLSVPGYLYYVSSGQLNLQVPWELQGHSSALMKVRVGESLSGLVTVPIASVAPAFFEYRSSGTLLTAALDQRNVLIGPNNAARRGETIQLFANGLGPVTNTPPSGLPAGSQPLSQTTSTPVVSIGGKTAAVTFSGLAPGFTGLYQVNVMVPSDAPAGIEPLTISIGGLISKTSNIPVQ